MDNNIDVTPLPPGIVNEEGAMATLPPGEYFVGDNGYLATENGEAWDKWVKIAAEMSQEFSKPVSGAMYGEYPVVGSNTAYGDGSYSDNHGLRYSVDSGMIGLTPRELLDSMNVSIDKFEALGHFITFFEPVTLSYCAGTIGLQSGDVSILIPTGD